MPFGRPGRHFCEAATDIRDGADGRDARPHWKFSILALEACEMRRFPLGAQQGAQQLGAI